MNKFKMEAWRQELYLAHHGILGMKWGRRQGPPYPLDAQDHSAAEKKAGWRKSLDGGSGQESKSKKRLTKDPSGGKIKKAIDNFKSDYKEGLKAQYLEKHNTRTPFHKSEGKTEADAEKYAESRMKVEKALLVVGGVAVTAMAAKYAYDYVVPQYVDRVLKEGTEFKRVVGSADSGLNRAFYMARSKGDARRYVGMYGTQVRQQGKDPHQLTGTVQKALKIASNKNAAQTFRELYESNPEFQKMAAQRIRELRDGYGIMDAILPAAKVAANAADRINSGRTKTAADFKSLYEAFNISMVDHGKSTDPALNQFYEALKKKGYGAINDINDQWYSGYNTNTANIVFDTESVVKNAVRKLENQEIDSINSSETMKSIVEGLLPKMGTVAALVAVGNVIDIADKGQEEKAKKKRKKSTIKKKEDNT